jgi:hypothetical protein
MIPVHESIMNWSPRVIELVAPDLCFDNDPTTDDLGGIAPYSESLLGMSQTSITFGDNMSVSSPSPSSSSTELPSPQMTPSYSLPVSPFNSQKIRQPNVSSDLAKVERMWQKRFDEVEVKCRKSSSKKARGAFQTMNPMFKELVTVLERNPSKLEQRINFFEWMIMDTELVIETVGYRARDRNGGSKNSVKTYNMAV